MSEKEYNLFFVESAKDYKLHLEFYIRNQTEYVQKCVLSHRFIELID